MTVGRQRVRVKVNYRRIGQFYSNVAAAQNVVEDRAIYA